MIRRLTPEDKDLMISIIQDKAVLPSIIDDGPLSDVEFLLWSDKVYCLAYDSGVLFILVPSNLVSYEVHTCILPQFRGEYAVEAAKLAIEWVFSKTPCQKISTLIPVINTAAYALACRAGMKKEGINRKSFLKNGCLYDQIIMGLCREDLCHSQPQLQ